MAASLKSRDSTVPRDLPLWPSLLFPLFVIAAIFATAAWSPALYARYWSGETGIIELGTVAVYLPGIVTGIFAFRLRHYLPDKRLGIWILVFIAGCIYVAGEEASWGQQFFGWQSPELFQEINKQQETNLHNSSTWLNQKPRSLMDLWVLIGGVLVPITVCLRQRGPLPPANWRYWLWPTHVGLGAAVVAVALKMTINIGKWSGHGKPVPLGVNLNESQELIIGIFLSIYLVSFYVRLRRYAQTMNSPEDLRA